jgi:hypothetical protein
MPWQSILSKSLTMGIEHHTLCFLDVGTCLFPIGILPTWMVIGVAYVESMLASTRWINMVQVGLSHKYVNMHDVINLV